MSTEGYTLTPEQYSKGSIRPEQDCTYDRYGVPVRMEKTIEKQANIRNEPLICAFIYETIAKGSWLKISLCAKYKITGTLNVYLGLGVPSEIVANSAYRAGNLAINGESSEEAYHYAFFKNNLISSSWLYIDMAGCNKGDWIEFTAQPEIVLIKNKKIIQQLSSE